MTNKLVPLKQTML